MVKIEIAHDTLARKIFEKVSAEDKMRRRVVLFLQDRQGHYAQTRQLLNRNDLHYVEPYLEAILPDLSEEVLLFVKRSRLRRARQKAFLVFFTLLAIAILGGFLVYENSNKKHFAALYDQLGTATREVEHKRDSLEELLKQNRRLFEENGLNTDSLKKVQKQRDQYLSDLQRKQDSLRNTNQKLERSARELAQAYKDLEEANRRIKEESERKLATAKQEKMNSQKASDLTQKAYEAYNKGNQKDAFQYAADAWKLDPNNDIAVDILRRLNKDIHKTPNWSTPPLNIIRDNAKRFNYKQ